MPWQDNIKMKQSKTINLKNNGIFLFRKRFASFSIFLSFLFFFNGFRFICVLLIICCFFLPLFFWFVERLNIYRKNENIFASNINSIRLSSEFDRYSWCFSFAHFGFCWIEHVHMRERWTANADREKNTSRIQLLFDAMCSIKFPVSFSIFFKSGMISVLYWIHCNRIMRYISDYGLPFAIKIV